MLDAQIQVLKELADHIRKANPHVGYTLSTIFNTHHTRHENGGADEVNVAGLSGLLADDQHVLDSEVTAVAIALTQKAAASGVASLDGSSLVVQNPANATATPTASKIPIADGSAKLDGWVTLPTSASSYSRTFLVNAFGFPDPISEWSPVLQGAYLSASLTSKICWLPLNFLKLGDIITTYNLVGDAIETTALTLDCRLVRVNKADPLTTTNITNGAITQITADGNFDSTANLNDETVITDSQYVLEITGTTGILDEIYVIGAEVTITRLI